MFKQLRRVLALVVLVGTLNCICFPAGAIKTTAQLRCTADVEQYVWDFFLELTDNPYAAAGIVGNLYYESHLLPENLETMGRKVPVFTDYTYTQAVDEGIYGSFVSDGTGYGLAQWTYSGRKQRLVDLARQQGRSVGSLDVQLDLVAEELDRYNMLTRLSSAENVRFASDYFMVHFENPKDKSEELKRERYKLCRKFYQKYALGDREALLTEAQTLVAVIAKNSAEYKIAAVPGYCQAWCADVYKAAGFKLDTSRSANESAERFAVSTDFSKIPVGAAVYGKSNSEFGHVGIYVGRGKVYHIADKLTTDTLEDWLRIYKGYAWGWIGGVDLTQRA